MRNEIDVRYILLCLFANIALASGGCGTVPGQADAQAVEDNVHVEDAGVDRGCGAGLPAPNVCGSCDGTVIDSGCGCGNPGPNPCDSCDEAFVDSGCGCGNPEPNACDSCDEAFVDSGCGCGNPVPNACGSCDGAIVEPGCELDLSLVTWLHTDVSNWAITSTVTDVTIKPGEVCVFHTAAGQWPFSTKVFPPDEEYPDGAPIEGNIWIFGFINGQWYGATWDWLRPGQQCKHESADTFGRDQIRIPPMDASWVPQKGDTIGLMMSTIARTSLRAGEERSNAVLVIWPY